MSIGRLRDKVAWAIAIDSDVFSMGSYRTGTSTGSVSDAGPSSWRVVVPHGAGRGIVKNRLAAWTHFVAMSVEEDMRMFQEVPKWFWLDACDVHHLDEAWCPLSTDVTFLAGIGSISLPKDNRCCAKSDRPSTYRSRVPPS
jgi:hypothetical protein